MIIRIAVDVIMERVPVSSRWISEKWQPAAVVPVGKPVAGEGPIEPGPPRLLHDGADCTQWCFPNCSLELHPSEAEGYYLTISSPNVGVFVMWRRFDEPGGPPARPVVVTLSYDEAARMMDGGEQVDLVPMEPSIHAFLASYVSEHYRPEPKKKLRRRDPLAPEADRVAGDVETRRRSSHG